MGKLLPFTPKSTHELFRDRVERLNLPLTESAMAEIGREAESIFWTAIDRKRQPWAWLPKGA